MSNNHYDWSNDKYPPFLQAHSVAKHEVLEAYLKKYIDLIASETKNNDLKLTIIDGFCGGGIYRHAETGKICSGSPLIFLDTVSKMEATIKSKRKKNFNINTMYYFIDNNALALSFLKSQLRKKGYGKLIGERIFLLQGSFAKFFPMIIEMIEARKGKAIFLLDQYGYKDAPLPLIKQIFKRCPNAEVLLTFAVDALINYIADTEQFRKCVSHLGLTGKLLTDRDIKKVEKLKKDKKTTNKWRLILEKKLLRRIIKISGARHNTPYFIVAPSSRRAYWFLHLSMHIKTWDEMLKLHWENHNCFVYHGSIGINMFGFNPFYKKNGLANDNSYDENARELIRNSIIKQLLAMPQNKTHITFRELLTSQKNTILASSNILKAIIQELQQHQKIEIIDHRTNKKLNTMQHWNNLIGLVSTSLVQMNPYNK
jgi:three-Cys-motif partner protein